MLPESEMLLSGGGRFMCRIVLAKTRETGTPKNLVMDLHQNPGSAPCGVKFNEQNQKTRSTELVSTIHGVLKAGLFHLWPVECLLHCVQKPRSALIKTFLMLRGCDCTV